MTEQRRTTIHDVAREAGVSIGTVSRVMNGADNVEPRLVRRVLLAAEALKYQPDIGARSMRSKQTQVVGVLVPDFRNPLASAAVAGIEEELSNSGYTIFLANSRYERKREERILLDFTQRRVDGIIAMVADDQDSATARQLEALQTPLVLLERETQLALDTVCTNQHDGAYRATRYLIGLGHKRVGLVSVPLSTFSGRARLSGYRAALAGAKIKFDEKIVRTDGYHQAYALDAVYATLASAQRPSALVVSGGLLSGALEAARQLNLSIPEDLSLVSLGDTELAAMATPPVTAVSYDWAEAGKVAAQLILARMAGQTPSAQANVVPYTFIIRQSCLPQPGARRSLTTPS